MSKPQRLSRIALIILMFCAALFLAAKPELVEPSFLDLSLAKTGAWAPLVFIFLFALLVCVCVPASLLVIAGGALFGLWPGLLYNLAGAVIGAALSFFLSRFLLTDLLMKKSRSRAAYVTEKVEKEGWRFVAFSRIVPIFPFFLINYLLGLTQIRFAVYLSTTAVCLLPNLSAYTYLGNVGVDAAGGNSDAVGQILLAVGFLAVVIYGPRLFRRFSSADQAEKTIESD